MKSVLPRCRSRCWYRCCRCWGWSSFNLPREKREACPIFKLTFLLLLPQVLIKALPLMIGWFSLNVPSGLGLYYLSNTLLTTGQQVFLRKFSGAAL